MSKVIQNRRIWFFVVVLAAAFAGLGFRLVDLQVWRHEELRAIAQKNTMQTILREPRRGEIRDIKGNVLATSSFVKTVCANPTLVGNYAPVMARALAPWLEMSEAELTARLQPRSRVTPSGQTVPVTWSLLKKKVKPETWEAIQQMMSHLPLPDAGRPLTSKEKRFCWNLRNHAVAVEPMDDQVREYPNHALAGHVIGYVGTEEYQVKGRAFAGIAGRDGIELTLNSQLSGIRGWRLTEQDSRRREVVAFRDQDVAPRAGLNVVLTLDSVVQNIVEGELGQAFEKHSPISASCIVVRPRTGEIVAMATFPNFDPNNLGESAAETRRNRAITDIAEPGSTFKVVVVSAALNEQIVTLSDSFDCEHGRFIFAGRALQDHESYGVLTVENIISRSSNIGAAKIGIKLGAPGLYDYIRNFGFGQRTGIPLAGEREGVVHPVAHWNKLSISRVPMGHEVAVTPLQMVMAMAAIANDGRLMRVSLIDRLEDEQGRVIAKNRPQPLRQVISPSAAHQMVVALKSVVSTNGTGLKGRLDNYVAAGKTGTAQKAGNGGYLPGKYFSSFIGFFPADDPQLCISVVLDEPRNGYYGGDTAAPVFKRIAERAANYFNIRPNLEPEALTVSNTLDPPPPAVAD